MTLLLKLFCFRYIIYILNLALKKVKVKNMIHSKINKSNEKGWFIGPWNSKIEIPVGYANQGINEKHYHKKMSEIYLVAKGTSKVIIGDEEILLESGDMLVVEPGEIHTFTENSPDYLHFVILTPFIKNDKVIIN
jgi:quercetin dioxygenase-like cupin family protein